MKKKEALPYQEAVARRDMYRFLSAVFLSPPSQSLLERIADGDLVQDLSKVFGPKAAASLTECADSTHFPEDMEFLKQEYMDLFAVPTVRYVTPFEDIYRGITVAGKQERGPLLGERAISAIRAYRAAGAEMDRMCKELPTHIGVELAFMSFLCGREALAIGDGEEKNVDPNKYRQFQIRFLKEHLNQWFAQLNLSIQMNAKSRFFRGLAMITEVFLAQDTDNLIAKFHSPRRISQKKDGKNGSSKYLECGAPCGTE